MRLMELSHGQSTEAEENEEEEEDNPHMMEKVLDSHALELEALASHLRTLLNQVHDTTVLLQLQLASSQNKLLRAEVSFQMWLTWMSLAGLVGSIFGMNLHSGLEWEAASPIHTTEGDPSWAFVEILIGTVAGTAIGGVLTTMLLFYCGVLVR